VWLEMSNSESYRQRNTRTLRVVETMRASRAGATILLGVTLEGPTLERRTVSSQGVDDVEIGQGLYVISVAARLLNMHPQTLRKYERLGLVKPTRSVGMLRLYSMEDVVRVRLIKYMVDDLGMNLAGVEFALHLLGRVMNIREKVQRLSRANVTQQLLVEELDKMLLELGVIVPRKATGL